MGGRPTAPGPASSFITAISERTIHYMAACDQNDEKNVECLLDWAPAVMNEPEEQFYQDTPWLATLKNDMDTMTPAHINSHLAHLKVQKSDITMELRDIKANLQRKDFEME